MGKWVELVKRETGKKVRVNLEAYTSRELIKRGYCTLLADLLAEGKEEVFYYGYDHSKKNPTDCFFG